MQQATVKTVACCHATIIFPPSRHGNFPDGCTYPRSGRTFYRRRLSRSPVYAAGNPLFSCGTGAPAALPHDRRAAVGLEVGVRLREVAAAEKSPGTPTAATDAPP